MSHVTSSDSLNGRCSSSDLSKDPGSPTAPNIPSTPSVGPEGQRSGPGTNVVQRGSSDACKEPGVEEALVEPPMSNGCFARYRTGNVRLVRTVSKNQIIYCFCSKVSTRRMKTRRGASSRMASTTPTLERKQPSARTRSMAPSVRTRSEGPGPVSKS